jgi:hypothetical protein
MFCLIGDGAEESGTGASAHGEWMVALCCPLCTETLEEEGLELIESIFPSFLHRRVVSLRPKAATLPLLQLQVKCANLRRLAPEPNRPMASEPFANS